MSRTLRRVGWCALSIVLVAIAASTDGHAATLSLTSKSLTTLRTCVVAGYPSTSTAVPDTFVQQANPTTNSGTATTMTVQSQNTNRNQRAFLSFDLTKCKPAIATTASIKVATLRTVVATLPATCAAHDVFRVTSAWAEGTVTWNTQPTVAATRTSSLNVGPAPCANSTTLAYVSWDVTSDVALFTAGTATNFGWMIRDNTESAATARTATYYTTEINVLGGAPELIVNYL